jgi:AAA family ATPase
VISGGSFEIGPHRGFIRAPRRRFLIEKIEPSSGADTSLTPFFLDFKSKVQIQQVVGLPLTPTDGPGRRLAIPHSGVGGLKEQLAQINQRVARLSDDFRTSRIPVQFRRNGGILLYGAEGTGKTLLLSKVAEASWARVLHVDESVIGPYVGQGQANLRKVFAEAVNYQPSVIIMDRLESLVGKVDRDRDSGQTVSLATTLANEMDKLRGRKVLVIGATIRPNDIDKSLRTPVRFRHEIELPIPNANARIEILKVLQHKDRNAPDAISEAIGEKTHGFVGQDLEALYETALEKAIDRFNSMDNLSNFDGGSETSEQTAHESVDESQAFEVSLADFEAALLEVHPTAMREVFLETPKVKWSDIGGSEHVKRALYKVTVRPFKVSSSTWEYLDYRLTEDSALI